MFTVPSIVLANRMRVVAAFAVTLWSALMSSAAAESPTSATQAATPSLLPAAPANQAVDAHDFIGEARVLAVVGACADGTAPAELDARTIAAHCAKVRKVQAAYREKWLSKAQPFMLEHVPADVPKTVVYPFAGGDLSTALTVYPSATEITTLSLEPAGDPRSLGVLNKAQLQAALSKAAYELNFLYAVNFSNTLNMISAMRGGKLPTELILALSALWVHGYEPSAVRYFTVLDDGTLHYLTTADLARAGDPARVDANKRNAFFANVEIAYRKRDGSAGGGTYRHISANLDDAHIAKAPGVYAHLQSKGKIAAMTKAASYLLAWDSFAKMRAFLLGHATWMISDATGVAPKWGKPAGFTYETWGRFEAPHLDSGKATAASWRAEWKAQPTRKLPFRFGYYDKQFRDHMVVMQRMP